MKLYLGNVWTRWSTQTSYPYPNSKQFKRVIDFKTRWDKANDCFRWQRKKGFEWCFWNEAICYVDQKWYNDSNDWNENVGEHNSHFFTVLFIFSFSYFRHFPKKTRLRTQTKIENKGDRQNDAANDRTKIFS